MENVIVEFANKVALAQVEWVNGATDANDTTKGIGRIMVLNQEASVLPMADRIAIRNLANKIYLSL